MSGTEENTSVEEPLTEKASSVGLTESDKPKQQSEAPEAVKKESESPRLKLSLKLKSNATRTGSGDELNPESKNASYPASGNTDDFDKEEATTTTSKTGGHTRGADKEPVDKPNPQSEEEGEQAEATKMEVDSEENDGGTNEEKQQNGSTDDREEADGTTADTSEEAGNSKAELPYSTRGRSTGSDAGGSAGESWERSTREAFDEIGRAKETTPTTMGTSFLESLSEEERRTRTRFLPDVDGMHTLRKTEIKGDLALARTMASGGMTNVPSSRKTKVKRSRASDDEGMDVDEDEGTSPSEDDRASDSVRTGNSTIEVRSMDLVVPSDAFVAPPCGPEASSNSDVSDTRDGHVSSSTTAKSQTEVVSPFIVESVTAFNPPRPPESIGAKKQHRMLRWERRPDDVEVDLSNYCKTVQRTRQELHTAEAEQERLETINAHLRRHFLCHLDALKEEYGQLNEEVGKIQQECVKAADLLTSRTRSRGAGKGSYVMRDVLTVLKSRGAEAREAGIKEAHQDTHASTANSTPAGLGGISGLSFRDWNQSTSTLHLKPANAWLFPGDKVRTPYGDGTVIQIHTENPSDVGKPKESSHGFSGDGFTNKQSRPFKTGGMTGFIKAENQKLTGKRRRDEVQSKPLKGSGSAEGRQRNDTSSAPDLETTLPPRVSVRLPYGIGHFMIGSLTSKETASSYSDSQLAKRWKQMHKDAREVGPCLDVEGMTSIDEPVNGASDDSDDPGNEENSQMDTEDGTGRQNENVNGEENSGAGSSGTVSRHRLLPFGAGLLPTSTGRGRQLHDLSLSDMEKGLYSALFDGGGVLGGSNNPGVPSDLKDGDDYQHEHCTLQASVLQLRNELCRQRRIRLLNERTFAATRDRSNRVEALVSEMRADLKSLKRRLDEELIELGIDEEVAEDILASYYQEQDSHDDGDNLTLPKRQRRMQMQDEDEGGMAVETVETRHYVDDGDRASADDLSGDDLEAHRAPKKIRPNQ